MEIQEGLGVNLIEKAELNLRTADHMAYVIYPLFKDIKLMKKIIEELRLSTINMINALLLNEYNKKRIPYLQDKKQNLELFKEYCTKFSFSHEDLSVLISILELVEKHKEGTFEFIRNNKLVIMSQGIKMDSITLEQLKSYLSSLKMIIEKSKRYLKRDNLS